VKAHEQARAVAALGARFDDAVLTATRALYAPHVGRPDGVTIERDLPYGSHDRHRIDLFKAEGAPAGQRLPVVLFVHGGGFVAGDKLGAPPFYTNVGKYFASHGYLAATMNYRLAPAYGWPAGSEDVAEAVDWLAEHAAHRGGDASRLHVIGQSAGACHVAGYLFDPALSRRAVAHVRAAALMSGFYQAIAPLQPGQQAYFGKDATQYPLRSPIRHVEHGAVPLLLTLAQFDPPGLASQTLALATACTRALGQCPPLTWLEGHNHVSTVMSLGTDQDDVGRLLRDFFNKDTFQ